jgi:hypothetical protein
MATTATLTYTATPVLLSAASLVTKMAAVVLPTSDLLPFGVSLTSDSTAVSAGNAVRTLVFSLAPIFDGFVPISPPSNFQFQGSIVSSSPQDVLGGTGVGQVQIRGLNVYGQPYIIQAALQGLTPVPLIYATGEATQFPLSQPAPRIAPWGSALYRRVDFVDAAIPMGATPAGMLTIYTSPNALSGSVMFQSVPTPSNVWQGSLVSTSEADTNAGSGGAGLRTVTVAYLDGFGAPQTEIVALNGTTPVAFSNTNHGTITGITPTTAGVFTANAGIVSILQGPNATGGIAGQLQPSFSAEFSTGTSKIALFKQLFLNILSETLQTVLTESISVV